MFAGHRTYVVSFLRISLLILLISCHTSSEIPVAEGRISGKESRLIITADDFGVCENVNQGIMLAAELGCITAISAFTNFPGSVETLKEISEQFPEIGIGVHLNVNTGRPVSDPELVPTLVDEKGGFFPIEEFVMNIRDISEEDVRTEMEAQVELLVSSGIKLDHISSHFGVFSVYTPYFEMRNNLAAEYGVPVRSPVSATQKMPSVYSNEASQKLVRSLSRKLFFRSPSTALKLNREFQLEEMHRKSALLDSLEIPHPDMLIDCFYGAPTPANLIKILDNLIPGTSELIVHLGTSQRENAFPPGLDTAYLKQRECELMTITSPYVKEYLNSLEIEKVSYTDLY